VIIIYLYSSTYLSLFYIYAIDFFSCGLNCFEMVYMFSCFLQSVIVVRDENNKQKN